MSDIMVDTETWGLRPGAALRSIGAVVFDPKGTSIGNKFYVNVELTSQLQIGLVQEQGTLDFWAKPENAKAAASFAEKPQVTIVEAMNQFTSFWRKNRGVRIWSQGANFDEPLLVAIYDRIGLQVPWKFWDSRCTRTHYAAYGFDPRVVRRQGTHHDALADAEHQVECVQRASRR